MDDLYVKILEAIEVLQPVGIDDLAKATGLGNKLIGSQLSGLTRNDRCYKDRDGLWNIGARPGTNGNSALPPFAPAKPLVTNLTRGYMGATIQLVRDPQVFSNVTRAQICVDPSGKSWLPVAAETKHRFTLGKDGPPEVNPPGYLYERIIGLKIWQGDKEAFSWFDPAYPTNLVIDRL